MAGFPMCPDCRARIRGPARPPLPRPAHRLPGLRAPPDPRRRPDGPDARRGHPRGRGPHPGGPDPGRQGARRLPPRLRSVQRRGRRPPAPDQGAPDEAAGPDGPRPRGRPTLRPASRRPRRGLLVSARRPIVLLEKKKDIPRHRPRPRRDRLHAALHAPPPPPPRAPRRSSWPRAPTPRTPRSSRTRRRASAPLCDAVLTHDRPIAMRADDSVVKAVAGAPALRPPRPRLRPLSAARPGRAPGRPTVIVALGGELKDTISLYKNGYVVTSQFLGDLDDYRNFGYFEETLAHLQRLFDARPEVRRHRPPSRFPDDPVRRPDRASPTSASSTTTPTSWRRSSSTASRPGAEGPGRGPRRLRVRRGRDGLGRRVPARGLRRLRALRPVRGGPPARRRPGRPRAVADGPGLARQGFRRGHPGRRRAPSGGSAARAGTPSWP